MKPLRTACLILLLLLQVPSAGLAAQVPQPGKILHVWAKSGLYLRAQPAPGSKALQLLPFGAKVTLASETLPLVPHELVYLTPAHQEGWPDQPITLHGHWLKVKAGKQEGYAFSRLLLPYTPKKPSEPLEKYLVRSLGLTNRKQFTQSAPYPEADSPERAGMPKTYLQKINVHQSPDKKVVLEEIDHTAGDASVYGHEGKITLMGMDFEEAVVFFHIIHPPYTQMGFLYIPFKRFEYSLDAVPNGAILEKKDNQIVYSWYYGLN